MAGRTAPTALRAALGSTARGAIVAGSPRQRPMTVHPVSIRRIGALFRPSAARTDRPLRVPAGASPPYHPPVGVSVSSPVVIGREAPLAALERALAATSSGARLLVLAGEAGIGKSRLLAEFVERARGAGARTAVGGCLDLADGGPGFLPFIEAFRRFVREIPPAERETLLGEPGRELARLVPDLIDPAGVDAGPVAVDQGRLFEVVLGLVGRLSISSPLVVAVEDAHWIDRSSRDLVTFLARNLGHERVLLLLTWRTEYLSRSAGNAVWLAELLRLPAVERIDLSRLDRDGVADLVRAIRGAASDPEFAERVWARSEGNPFFVEELLAAPSSETGAPPALVDVLAARVATLPAAARPVLAALAVAGRPVDDELLAGVVGRPIDAVRAALREPLDRFVLELDRDAVGVRFRHALLREVVAAELLPGERRSLHERFAHALEPRLADRDAAGPALLADLARHWDGAERPREAYEATLAAARSASRVAAHGHADGLYERAIELSVALTEALDARQRLSLLREAADEADLGGSKDRAVGLVREAIELARSIDDVTLEGILHDRLGYLLWRIGDPVAGLAAHEVAAALVPAEPPTQARARVLAGLGGAYFSLGRYADARTTCEEAILCAEAVGARQDEARARNMLGSSLVALGELEAGLRELELSREIAAVVGPPETLIGAHYNLALNLAESGRVEAALAEAMSARVAAAAAGLEHRYGLDLAALVADSLLRLGRWDEADAVLAEGFRLDRTGEGSVFLAMVRGRLHALRGELAAAERNFERVRGSGALDADVAAYLARGRAERALAAGRPGEALELAEELNAHLAGSDEPFARPVYVLGLRGLADLAASSDRSHGGDVDERLAGAAVRLAALVSGGAHIATEPAQAWRALAHAERRRFGGTDTGAEWRAAAALFEALSDPYHVAYARLREAEAELRAHGVRAAAAAPLLAASAIARRLGAEPLRRDVDALARRARVDLAASSGTDDAPAPSRGVSPAASPQGRGGPILSARELEVLRLVADGRSNGQIAERLFISRKTASVHVSHILDKLGVGNRVEAAMVAARLGLLEPVEADQVPSGDPPRRGGQAL